MHACQSQIETCSVCMLLVFGKHIIMILGMRAYAHKLKLDGHACMWSLRNNLYDPIIIQKLVAGQN